jgi:hypothetical protein
MVNLLKRQTHLGHYTHFDRPDHNQTPKQVDINSVLVVQHRVWSMEHDRSLESGFQKRVPVEHTQVALVFGATESLRRPKPHLYLE